MNKDISLSWNLDELYKHYDDPALAADFSKADDLLKNLSSYRERINSLAPSELHDLIKQWEDLAIIFDKIGLFAGLSEAIHIGDAETIRFTKKIHEEILKRSTQLLFIEVELSRLSEERWQAHRQADILKPYAKTLEKLYQLSKHTLSEAEEKILAEKRQTSYNALEHLYSITTNTLEIVWDNTTLTLEQLISKFSDPEAAVRKKAAQVLHKTLESNSKTTPAILNFFVQDKSIEDKLHHYDAPEASRYLNEDVESETVRAMVTAINSRHDLVTRYYKLKQQILGAEKLYWWDRYAPLPETKSEITVDQAKAMVKESFGNFTPELATIVGRLYDSGHIDWLPSSSKRGGAFCAFGGSQHDPYVLMNFDNKPRDVMTLAHELGHAVHDVLARDANVFFQTHPSLALAEIASTFGESLLFDKLMSDQTLNTKDKIALLMANVEDRFATVFRQAAMFQFEQQLHHRRAVEGELSKEQIDALWHETMKKPFEGALEYTDEHKNTWMYVTHVFEWPFYVFTYAYAQLCSLALYQQYKEKGQEFVPTYLNILKAGGSLSPKDNLAQAGLDIQKAEFWQSGLKVIEDSIVELEELVKINSDMTT